VCGVWARAEGGRASGDPGGAAVAGAGARRLGGRSAFQAGEGAPSARWSWVQQIRRSGETARLFTLAQLHSSADRLEVKSQWPAEYRWSTLGIPSGTCVVAYSGVPLEHYRGPAPARHRHRLVYTSQMRRGLDHLLDLFPRIRAVVPEAELHVFGYEHTDAPPLPDPHGATQPGVHWRGSLGTRTLAYELRTAGMVAHPCTLREIFCTAVAAAQDASLPVVTSDRAALAERVTHGMDGFLISRHLRECGYQDVFVEAVGRLFRYDGLWIRLESNAVRKANRFYSWDSSAAGWEDELRQAITGREPLPPRMDPTPDLLAAEILTVADRGVGAHLPSAFAGRWLRGAWAAYGYHAASTPGLVRSSVAVARRG
jgi:glycosyltransferase involved in cell wall biosynthesis